MSGGTSGTGSGTSGSSGTSGTSSGTSGSSGCASDELDTGSSNREQLRRHVLWNERRKQLELLWDQRLLGQCLSDGMTFGGLPKEGDRRQLFLPVKRIVADQKGMKERLIPARSPPRVKPNRESHHERRIARGIR
jgi:hypothetical protein